MATHKSAEKRYRQSLKRRDRNRHAVSTIRSAVKDTLAAAGDKKTSKEAAEALRKATRLIDKAVVHGVMHKKTAARHISRLAKRVSAAS